MRKADCCDIRYEFKKAEEIAPSVLKMQKSYLVSQDLISLLKKQNGKGEAAPDVP